jgi:hypothetical protein
MLMHAWTIPIVRLLKTSYVMQSKTSKNNSDSSGGCMGLQELSACDTAPASEMDPYLRVHPVSRIVSGLSENLRNVQKHRSLIKEEINDVLEKLMFSKEGRHMAANLTGTKKEE